MDVAVFRGVGEGVLPCCDVGVVPLWVDLAVGGEVGVEGWEAVSVMPNQRISEMTLFVSCAIDWDSTDTGLAGPVDGLPTF